MASTTQSMEQVSLKLIVNQETNKVLFAEATKEFVDILFSFLTLPLGTLSRLLQKKSNIGPITLGCLDTLYQNVEDLHKKFLYRVPCKEMLLNPKNSCYCSTLKLNIDDIEPKKYFVCSNFGSCSHRLLYTSSGSVCYCRNKISLPVFLNDFPEGFVNDGVITYCITDDLIVIPNSLGTSLGWLQNLGVKSISSIKEVIVNVTTEQMLELLKYSLLSKTTLTDFFLRKIPFLEIPNLSPCRAKNRTRFQIKVKLTIRKSDGKIMYAQGGEDFAELLLCFLTFPLGGVVRMLGGNCSLGSIDGLHRSIADLDEKYFMSREVKHRLVDSRLALNRRLRNKLLPIHESNDLGYYVHYMKPHGFYEFHNFIITDYKKGGDADSIGWLKMDFDFEKDPLTESGGKGFVEGPAMYMATDDLIITPISPVSAIHLLRDLKMNPSDLYEKDVTIGIKECCCAVSQHTKGIFVLSICTHKWA